jgi:hypothetical protein
MARNTIGVGLDGKHNAFARKSEPALTVHHDPNEARKGDHGVKGNIARDGAPKRMHPVSVHNAMSKVTKDGSVALGGDHASAIDSLTGGVVVPGAAKSAPGWGNGDVRSGNPMARPPASKNLKPVQATPGMRSRTSKHDPLIGAAILASALCNK